MPRKRRGAKDGGEGTFTGMSTVLSKRVKPKRATDSVSRTPLQRYTLWALPALAVLLIGAGFVFFTNQNTATGIPVASTEYDPEMVVQGDPLYGKHEMGPSNVQIPFLPADGPQPKLVLPHDRWSFGSVGPTEVVEHTFALKNEGEAPLTVSRIYTTCGCTTAELSARVIPPGKVALLRMIFDAGYHDTRGQTVQRGVVIESNDPAHSEAVVWADASVRPQ